MNSNFTVTIGIAAYNAGPRIVQLVESLLVQKNKNWSLEKIIIHSDCSKDDTVANASKIKDSRVVVIDNQDRKGFAGSVKTLLANSQSDITLLLNDDIRIIDHYFVNKLVKEFSANSKVGLVTGRPVPMSPENFVQKAVITTLNAYENGLYRSGNYHNIGTCDGKILAVSSKFKTELLKDPSTAHMGNVDSFLYLACVKNQFVYRDVPEARVYFRAPSTFSDWIKLTSRNNADQILLRKTFGSLTDTAFSQMPMGRIHVYMIIESLKNPFGAAAAILVSLIAKYKAKRHASWLKPTWDVVTTTKAI